MPGRNIFLSYATGSFIPARDALCQSALDVGFDEARPRGPDDLDQNFFITNKQILLQPRGGGYWLWKPKIILEELRSLKRDDLLVYSDAGRSSYYLLKKFPEQLANRARTNGYLLGPTIGQHGPMSHWTKRDAFVLLGCDDSIYHNRAPIQATWSLWTPHEKSFMFLESWLQACMDPRILTDIPNTQGLGNLPGFRDHRHDQAILSLLAFKCAAPYLDYRGKPIEKILMLRPQSALSNLFLKRIDDAERCESGRYLHAIASSWWAIKKLGNC